MARKRRKMKKGINFFILIIIALLCVFAYFFFNKKEDIKVNKVEKTKVEQKEEKKKDKSMSLVMVGDVLIHDSVLADAKKSDGTYDFSNMFTYIKPIIKDYDLKYVNEESIIGDPSLGYSGYPGFNAPEAIGDNLVDLGFNLIGLANNHAMDKGEKSILNSNNYWKSKNVITAGTYSSEQERANIPTYEENGIKYAFLSYTTVTNTKAPKSYLLNMYSDEVAKSYLLNMYSDEVAKSDIESIKSKVDVIIVAMHWGEEYTNTPTSEEVRIAKYLESLGVNLVIGTHPHVVQPIEYINDALVIYSLGNFISNQLVLGENPAIGLLVGVDITLKDKVEIKVKEKELLYAYSQSSTNFKVIPFSKLTDNELSNHKTVEAKYMDIVGDV